jgi:hypothetical protein
MKKFGDYVAERDASLQEGRFENMADKFGYGLEAGADKVFDAGSRAANALGRGIGSLASGVGSALDKLGIRKYRDMYEQGKDQLLGRGVDRPKVFSGGGRAFIARTYDHDLLDSIAHAAERAQFTPEEAAKEDAFWTHRAAEFNEKLKKRGLGRGGTGMFVQGEFAGKMASIFRQKHGVGQGT